MPADTATALDAAIADLFTLDRRAEPAEDLTGYACSADCTDNGCSGLPPANRPPRGTSSGH